MIRYIAAGLLGIYIYRLIQVIAVDIEVKQGLEAIERRLAVGLDYDA